MDKELIKQAFRLGYKAASANFEKAAGLGLGMGLANANKLVRNAKPVLRRIVKPTAEDLALDLKTGKISADDFLQAIKSLKPPVVLPK